MKQRIVPAILYATTALSLLGFIEAIYGAGPVLFHRGLVYCTIAGAILFGVAGVLAFLTKQLAIFFALIACALSWSELYPVMFSPLPWSDLVWFVRYRPDQSTAFLCLIASTVYSLVQLLRRSRQRSRKPI